MSDLVIGACVSLIGVVAGFGLGIVGRVVDEVHWEPIRRFKRIRREVLSDLEFYAVAIDYTKVLSREKVDMRRDANRRHSTDLKVIVRELPNWYKRALTRQQVSIDAAAVHLMGLSNTLEHDAAQKRVDAILKHLGVKTPVP